MPQCHPIELAKTRSLAVVPRIEGGLPVPLPAGASLGARGVSFGGPAEAALHCTLHAFCVYI